MRRLLRWLKRGVLGTLALAVLAVGIALIVLHTDWGREHVRARVAAALAESFPGGARIGRLEGSVLGELVARDVELLAADKQTYAKVAELRIDLALRPLLGKTARIERLVASEAELYPLRVIAPPVPDEEEGPDEPGAWSVELPAIKVHRARVVIELGAGAPVTLDGLELAAAVSMPAGAPIDVSAQLRSTWRERGVPVEGSLAVRAGEVVALPKLELQIGGASVRGTDVAIDPALPTGAVKIEAPAGALERLLPGIGLVAAASLDVTLTRAGSELAVRLTGGYGATKVTGTLHADVAGARVRGVVTAKDVALGELTGGAHTGGGAAIIALVADRARIAGTAIATGAVDALPAGNAVVSFDVAIDEARARAGALVDAITGGAGLVLASGGGASARGFGTFARLGGALAVDTGHLAVSARDVGALARPLAGEAAPVRGGLALDAQVSGTLAPLDVAVTGTLAGERVAYGEDPADSLSARRLSARFRGTARGSLAAAVGTATGAVHGVADAGVPRGSASFGAELRADRTIAAWVKAWPAAAPITIDATAVIRPGTSGAAGAAGGAAAPMLVELGAHAITMPGGERWTGRGGRIVIEPARVVLERLRTTSRGGRVDAAATFDRETKRLALRLDADAVAAASIDPAYRGTASGQIRLARSGLRWDGTVLLGGRGLAFAPDAAPLDADLRLEVAGRHVVLQTGARVADLGGVRFDLDVDGPADLTDVDGWLVLPRAAVRSARLGIDRADLGAAAVPTGGVVDGSVYIAGADTSGTVSVRGVRTPLGDLEGDITFRAEDKSQLGASSTVHIRGLGDADVSARIAFPLHPFDPADWQRLGRGALARLGASLSDVAIDPERLAALGIEAPYRGTADVDLVLADGATSATVDVDVKGITGGPIVAPIDVHVAATVDPAGTRVRAHAADTRPEPTQLLALEGAIPSYSIDRWIAAPAQARHAPLDGVAVTIPGLRGPDDKRPAAPLDAPVLLAVLGRDDLASGKILGTVSIGGTLGAPTAGAKIELGKLVLARHAPGRPAAEPTDLVIEARWGGAAGRGAVTVTGKSGRGTFVADAEGAPADPAKVLASLTAKDFEIGPLAAFLPGELHAARGKLGGRVTLRGLDASAGLLGRIRGQLTLAEAAVPLDPMLGTLRDGTATVRIDDRGVALDVAGALGSGKLTLAARSAGHDLAVIDATGKLDDVSPLGEWEPVIDADITAKLRKSSAEQWTGSIEIRNASAVLPPSGEDLGDPDKPLDLLFVEDGPIPPRRFALGGRAPARPWLVADVELLPMKVYAEDLFDTRGEISGKLQLEIGDTIGLVGGLDIENGIVGDLFGRRYTATGGVTFDGTLEPKVDITLQHKFPALVLTVLLQGNPATLIPDFRSDPPSYTRDQLAGFFIGGEPGGDPSTQTREAATGAGAAVLSSTLGARIRKRLPIKIEQLGCDPGNSVTAASCTVGRWFGEKLFVAFKRRVEAQEDDTVNANEVQGQYYLRRDLYLEMVGGDAGSGGLDLLWRRRW
ncbi:MAG TPA: translocation/assembly module TamB domain-containing protein [Kofleriaceae bacterium]|nr:translocation/assembly module TamB domain-containing protein [Kofleriaceae bacterium]